MRHLALLALLVLGCNTKGGVTIGDTTGDSGANDTDTSADTDTSDTDTSDTDTSDTGNHGTGPDADGDGYGSDVDCDDTNAAVHPDAAETCDGVDDDCDGLVDGADDSVTAPSWYADADGDGYGTDASAVVACEQPSGTVAYGGDCNDADPAYHPGATESCTDPVDYNCDGSTGNADVDADGFVACLDCNDMDAAINPTANEVCDGVDNDCDTYVDDADPSLTGGTRYYVDADGDGHGSDATTKNACALPAGYSADKTDCDDTNAAISPDAAETCDGVDDDCDHKADDKDQDLVGGYYPDDDGDGYGNQTRGQCTAKDGWITDWTDCDDGDATISPGAAEICADGIDQDCDGTPDDGC